MPPVLPFLPLIADAVSAAGVGLGISNSLSKPNTPTATPVENIAGSPAATVNSGSTSGNSALPANGVLGQIIGSKPSIVGSGGLAPGGGGAAHSAAAPAGIGGGGGDLGSLPWITGASSPAALPAPGTPGAI